MKSNLWNFGFIRVAALVPPLKVGDIDFNVKKIIEFANVADDKSALLAVFPELSVTGYTLGDLFFSRTLLSKAATGLEKIAAESKVLNCVLVVGLPLESEGKIFNAAAVVFRGKIYGFVPKTYIPGYKEFYEERWFASARDLNQKEIVISRQVVPIGRDLLFKIGEKGGAVLGVEICEDVWTPLPPSSNQVLAGANIIANLSASNELVGKADYRRSLVAQQSARGIAGYVYASSGVHESTTDVVFGGHALIAENGYLLAESNRFKREGEIIISEIDIKHLEHDRVKTTTFGESIHESRAGEFRTVAIPVKERSFTGFYRTNDPHPFVPQDPLKRDERSKEIFSIQVAGLAKRLEYAKISKVLIGVSGGLDSTLALLVSVNTFKLLKYPLKNIYALTMPGFGTTKRTKTNAEKLCGALGVSFETIDIKNSVSTHFKDIKHDPENTDRTYENAQARYRTMILMDKANQLGGLVVGTGDLSELALGWNTFSGDQISNYNVNAGIPKTLVKYLVSWAAETQVDEKSKKILKDILDTPISPELVKNHKHNITQKTEELIGPYELHDFFMYHFLRWGSSPAKILFLADSVFNGKYSQKETKKWLKVFIQRFFSNQWKRSVMPDGPKVGSVALSPRGDWRMPSDAEAKIWLNNIQ